jgi:hypothetical protein
MKHLKTMNELFGLFSKPNPDVTKAEELVYKLRNEKFEIDQQIRENRVDFFVTFEDEENTQFVVTLTSVYNVFVVSKVVSKLHISQSLSKQIYDIVSRNYRLQAKSKMKPAN